MVFHRGTSTFIAAALFYACAASLLPQISRAQGNISGCESMASEAADTETGAAQAYANGHYQEGALGYQQAADLYHLCSLKASDPGAKDRAFYAYVLDLAFAAQHASDGSALLQKVRKEADAFLRRSSSPDLVAKMAALKNDPKHPQASSTQASAQGIVTPITPLSSPGRSSAIDKAACASALANFWKPYGDWFSARVRYIGSVQKTQRLLPKGNAASFIYGPASVNVILELKAIRSVVDAEEPKLRAAKARLEATGAAQTVSAVSDIVQAIQQLDANELAWTQARYNTITALANGQPAPAVPAYSTDTANQLGAQIKSRWDQLHGANACAN